MKLTEELDVVLVISSLVCQYLIFGIMNCAVNQSNAIIFNSYQKVYIFEDLSFTFHVLDIPKG